MYTDAGWMAETARYAARKTSERGWQFAETHGPLNYLDVTTTFFLIYRSQFV